jgi:hypothetical protein
MSSHNLGSVFETRWRALGHGRFTLRLKRPAMDALDALCERHGCNRRDAIEAMLLGTIDPRVVAAMHEHGLSESEARYVVAEGIAA